MSTLIKSTNTINIPTSPALIQGRSLHVLLPTDPVDVAFQIADRDVLEGALSGLTPLPIYHQVQLAVVVFRLVVARVKASVVR